MFFPAVAEYDKIYVCVGEILTAKENEIHSLLNICKSTVKTKLHDTELKQVSCLRNLVPLGPSSIPW